MFSRKAALRAAAAASQRPYNRIGRLRDQEAAFVGPLVTDITVSDGKRMIGGTEPGSLQAAVALGSRGRLYGVTSWDSDSRFNRGALTERGIPHDLRLSWRRTASWLLSERVGEGKVSNPVHDPQKTADKFYSRRDLRRLGDLSKKGALVWGASSAITKRYQRALSLLIKKANLAGVPTLCDPNIRVTYQHDLAGFLLWLRSMLPHCNVVRMNRGEAAIVLDREDISAADAVRELKRRFQPDITIVSDDKNGAYIAVFGDPRVVHIPALVKNQDLVIDPTGAGDNQLGGFLRALEVIAEVIGPVPFHALPLIHAARGLALASDVAGMSIQGPGAFPERMTGDPEVVNFLAGQLQGLREEVRADPRGQGDLQWEVVAA